MKKWTSKLVAAFLAVAMVVTGFTPTALAAPKSESKAAVISDKFELPDNAKSMLEAAKAMHTYSELAKKDVETSPEKEAIKDAIFHNFNDETDLSDLGISSKEMDKLTEEVLEENSMENAVDVTYETDANGDVTTVSVEMDSVLAQAAEETAPVPLTQEQKDDILARYAAYQQSMISMTDPSTGQATDVQDLFGVQAPYFTSKDTAACPIGSLLSIAGLPNSVLEYGLEAIVANGIMDYATITGILDLFTYANQFAVMMKGEEMGTAIQTALGSIPRDADTTEEVLLYINDWLAQNCTFDMPYIMEMTSPEKDTTSEIAQDRQAIYTQMYDNIKGMVYQQVYDQVYPMVYDQVYNQVYETVYNLTLVNTGDEATAAAAAEAEAKTQAEAYAKSEADTNAAGFAAQYMDAPTQDGSDNGATSAMTLATSIINLWEGNHVGALTYGTAVCLGYSNAYTLLVQHAFPSVYRVGGKSDGAWKTYEELNKGSAGSWSAMVDYVRISFDTEVTMFGVTQDNFTSDHYWNAVKVNNKWYYVDPCYTDVFVEVMARDRVETNGNMNHLYFLFSHDSAESLYEGYYSIIDTAYKGVATDKKYEEAWFAFARSPIFTSNGYYYYTYDSTDMIGMQTDGFQSDSGNNFTDMESMMDSTEYKVVRYKASGSMTGTDYETLVEFPYAESVTDDAGESSTVNHGAMVYNPTTKAMEADALVQELYEKHKEAKEDYPSIVTSVAVYNNKVYFNLANCILTYDISTGAVERVYEYNEVYGERDMQKAFGGMAFTTTTASNADVEVKNPPIAGFTIKGDKLYVDIATTLGFISGKDRDDMEDPSSYGYKFEETNYNDEYMIASYSDMGNWGDTTNDNDEFMWSANILDEVDLKCSHSYGSVSVDETCTNAEFSEQRCTKCGFVQSSGMKETTVTFKVVDTNGKDVNTSITALKSNTLERNFSASAFSYENAKANVEKVLEAGKYLGIEMPETVEWGKSYTATVYVQGEAVESADDITKNPEVSLDVSFVEEVAHTHVDACYSEAATCGKEAHDHEACTLTCTETATDHKHEDTCYGCGKAAHTHVEKECYLNCKETIDEVALTGKDVTIKRRAASATATEYTFDGDEIASYIPEGYKVSGTVADVKALVNTGATTTTTKTVVNVVKDTAAANLQVVVKYGETELSSTLLSNTTGTSTGVTFTAAQIKACVSDDYAIKTTVEDTTVAFGKKQELILEVEEAKATATLTIKATGASDVTLTKEGKEGETAIFTAAEIKAKVTVAEGQAITSIVSDKAVKYGATGTVNVTVASTAAAVEGHGHKYVQFNETYYTRRDEENPDSAFNTGTCYVCIYCKDSVDEKPASADMYSLSNKNSKTDVWTWSLDLKYASLYEIPTELDDILLDCVWENSNLGSKRTIATVDGPTQTGKCTDTNGIKYEFKATANGKTATKSYNEKHDTHLYSDSAITYNWAADYSACTASYKCLRCGDAGTANCTVDKREVVASCVDDAYTLHTAKIELAGVPYTNQVTIPGEGKATGHVFDDKYPDICQVCGWEKMDSVVSLPSTVKVSYTGKTSAAINGVKAATVVEGSTGSTSRTYYSDKACTKKVTTSTGASKAGYAPSKIGVYYVKVTVKADSNYKKATSNVCKLVIAPKQTKVSAYNTSSGIYLYWDKVSHADGYRIYRREHNGTYERVYSTSKVTTLSWTDKNAAVGTNYEYDVRPYKKASGTTIYSITRTDDAKTAARTRLTLTNTRSGVSLSWDKVYNATGYTVWRKASTADSYTKIATIKSGSIISYKDTRAKNGTKYYYYVRPTGDVTVRTNKPAKTYLEATEITKLSSPKAGQLKVTWEKNSKAQGYQVRYSTSSSFSSYKTSKITSNGTVSKTLTGLSKGKTYYVKVRSYKKVGDTTYYSAWTVTDSFKTKK